MNMQVAKNSVITLDYHVTDPDGEVVDEGREPLVYLHGGYEDIFPKIEEPLGSGDVLLALMMGLMLGFPNVVGALVVGPLIAGAVAIVLLITRRSSMGDFMPYGVSLCVASILFLLNPAPLADALHLPALVGVFSNLF